MESNINNQITVLIPSLNNDIYYAKSSIEPGSYEICRNERMLVKANEDIIRLLKLIDGKINIEDITNQFNPSTEKKHEITKLIYSTLVSLQEEGIVRLDKNNSNSFRITDTTKSYYLPRVVTLELTNHCNFYCRYCFQNSSPTKNIYLENPIKLLLFLKELGVECVELSGGEPTLHPAFHEIINFIVDNFYSYSLITNGTTLNDEILSTLKKGLGAIQICLDGSTEEKLSKAIGITGMFNKIIEGIKKAVKYNIPVRVGMVLDDAKNIDDIENVLLIAKNLGAHSFVVNPAMNIGRGINLKMFSDEDIKHFTLKHNSLIEKYPDFYGLETISWDKLFNARNCGAGSQKLTVNYNEQIKLCSLQGFDWLDFGYIYDIKKEEVQRKIKTAFELPAPTKELCGNCINTYYCMKCTVRPLNLLKVLSFEKSNCHWYQKYSNQLKVLGY